MRASEALLVAFALLQAVLLGEVAEAKNPAGGKGVAETGPGGPDTICTDISQASLYLERICIDKVQAKWRAYELGGDALTFAEVRWMRWTGGGFETASVLRGKGFGDIRSDIHLINAPAFVIKALDELDITEMAIRGLIELKRPTLDENDKREEYERLMSSYGVFTTAYGRSNYYMPLDPGALASAGKYSYNTTPSVVPWDRLFDKRDACPGDQTWFADEKTAKHLFEIGFRISRLDICGFTVSGLSVLDAALEKSCLAWDFNSEKYKNCMRQCPEGMRVNGGSGRDRDTFCDEKPPLNIAHPPIEPTKEDVEFASALEKELAAATGLQTEPKQPTKVKKASSNTFSSNLQSQLMTALQSGGSGSSGNSAKGKAPFGLTDKQWAKIQEQRSKEVAALGPLYDRQRASCDKDMPERPEEPHRELVLYSNACDTECRRKSSEEFERRYQERLGEYRQDVRNYERNLEEWKMQREACFRKADKDHVQRQADLAEKHKKDDARLKQIHTLSQQLKTK